jgi:hypothetical protein
MNMYEAVKAAAAHIAKYPDLYNYNVTRIPQTGDEGPQAMGCMLGRLAHIVGFEDIGRGADAAAPALLGISHSAFFERIVRIMNENRWMADLHDAKLVAPAMLIYAQRHRADLETREYPVPNIPKIVLDIFTRSDFFTQFAAVDKALLPAGAMYNVAADSYELVPN